MVKGAADVCSVRFLKPRIRYDEYLQLISITEAAVCSSMKRAIDFCLYYQSDVTCLVLSHGTDCISFWLNNVDLFLGRCECEMKLQKCCERIEHESKLCSLLGPKEPKV
jgi:hypothetical protein